MEDAFMKSQIELYQDNNNIFIKIELDIGYEVTDIFLEHSETGKQVRYPVEFDNGVAILRLPFDSLLRDLKKHQTINVDEISLSVQARWHWYASIRVDEEDAPAELVAKLNKRVETDATIPGKKKYWTKENRSFHYDLRIGKFKRTSVNGLQIVDMHGHQLFTYLNKHGYLNTVLDDSISGKNKLQLESVRSKGSTLKIEGRLNTGYFDFRNAKAILKSRTTTTEVSLDLILKRDEEKFRNGFGKNIYSFFLSADFDGLLPDKNDIYDLYLEGKKPYQPEPERIRVGRPTFRARYFFREFLTNKTSGAPLLINPYYTIYKSNMSFEVTQMPEENYRYLKRLQRYSGILQVLNRHKDIWLVGERPYKAQDTGYAFFKYMRTHHPEKNVYYVVSKDSPEYENVAPLGNVVEFGSKEHIKLTLIATKIYSSHHPNYLYPIRTKSFEKAVSATKIFLQHGVLGGKNMANIYSATSKTFNIDLFVTSSDYEKEKIVVGDMGYNPKDVIVTGLSRFDTLFNNDTEVKRQILIIPTWRDWLQDVDSFLDSEYFERYRNLVNNPELHRLAEQHDFEILLCLHPNMQIFSDYFEGTPVRVIHQGEIDVQSLIKESALMITDYSSVAFDFSFLHKPVVYYQFDRERFLGKRGSHLDMDQELPGDIVREETEVIGKIREYAGQQFKANPETVQKANKFIKYRDTRSSERIYLETKDVYKKRTILAEMKKNDFLRDLFTKFRKSNYYFPTMKVAYSLMRRVLPVKKNKVFLESGLGKSLGDSPKEIYDVLQKSGKDYEFVWSYNRRFPNKPQNTKVVKRLSPGYYYHLATSGYWINNQNFPTYIKKRKGTRYLQTWHGTPLKRMLHDIELIHGRDETYLERVSSAIQEWDALISPSRYATECFRSAFRYKGPVIEQGYPRNDVFYQGMDNDQLEAIRNKLGIAPGKKVILYAPTFRDNENIGNKFIMDIPMDFERFKERFGEEYVLLTRLHVVVSNKLRIPKELSDTVINASNYPDIQELMLISDILITDYSSVWFDFLNTNQPILFYTYDFEEYRDSIRGFYLDFENEAPGPLCMTEGQLMECISDIEKITQQYRQAYQEAQNKFCYLDDGHAAERTVKEFFLE
ncbi:CDP-glycerol--glycerophosphate glycerophosphotransferase [Bhargavaea beijingensis]|uniref:CDP-glycerol--glycerophosphate glycerophosphotransferase n=2 Tax=Bhargavaea beijingensis TaxID=426756 RepID=A0ABX9ZFV3_9BACL|nr:CDP-glycerol--glycerophosphate glycerophosphotransferase [Bhargavaea beijingensis]